MLSCYGLPGILCHSHRARAGSDLSISIHYETPGIRPLKEQMGIEGNRSSAAVHRAMVDLGSEKSCERATRPSAEHYGWEVGRGTLRNQTGQAAQLAEQSVEGRLAHACDAATPETPSLPVDTLVVELDGCEIRTGQVMTAAEAGRGDLPPVRFPVD